MTSLLDIKNEIAAGCYEQDRRQNTDAEIFRQAGFYSVAVGFDHLVYANWPDIHRWCQEQFGKDHYTWTGSVFWFENEQDAVLFALRWR